METQLHDAKSESGKLFSLNKCFRFRKSKNTNTIRHYSFVKPWLKYLTLFPAFFYTYKINSYPKNMHYKNNNAKHSFYKGNKKTVVHGWLKCTDTKKGISNAKIKVVSNGRTIAKSISFANGSYFISIPNNEIWKFKIDLEYNGINYYTKVIKDIQVDKPRIACDIALKPMEIRTECVHVCEVYEQISSCTLTNTTCCYPYEVKEVLTYCPVNSADVVEKAPVIMKNLDSTITIEPLVSIETRAYPNPFRDVLQIAISNSNQAAIYVFDLSGKLIETINTTESLVSIDLIEHPNGIYIIKTIDMATQKGTSLKVVKTS